MKECSCLPSGPNVLFADTPGARTLLAAMSGGQGRMGRLVFQKNGWCEVLLPLGVEVAAGRLPPSMVIVSRHAEPQEEDDKSPPSFHVRLMLPEEHVHII